MIIKKIFKNKQSNIKHAVILTRKKFKRATHFEDVDYEVNNVFFVVQF